MNYLDWMVEWFSFGEWKYFYSCAVQKHMPVRESGGIAHVNEKTLLTKNPQGRHLQWALLRQHAGRELNVLDGL